MAKVATKKSVAKAQKKSTTPPFSFSITQKDIIEREHFGSFEVIITKKGALYKNYTGYHVFFTPYCVGIDGKAHETSSYAWLVNLVNTKKAFKGHENEPFMDEESITKGEVLQTDIIMTEAVLSHPMTAFIDIDKTAEFAKQHMIWLDEKTKELEKAINTPVEEETTNDVKANLEHDTKIIAMEEMAKEFDNSKTK